MAHFGPFHYYYFPKVAHCFSFFSFCCQVLNYTETGFLKIRAPEEVFRLLRAFWEANKDRAIQEWETTTPYHNNWEASTTIIRVDNATLEGGGSHLQQSIAIAARDAMEAWTGLPQSSTSVYGIRTYHTGSILAPHVDRLPLVSSAIINVAQGREDEKSDGVVITHRVFFLHQTSTRTGCWKCTITMVRRTT
jgi:hypothetical protein